MNEQEEEMSGGVEDSERKLREAEWERQRWRQREERETKGMWSSPSLCLAAQWLKRRVPGEREAALGLPSQFSRSLDLLRVAHRNIPPNLQEGLLLLHWIPPKWLQRICKASTDCRGTGSSQFRGRRSALDEPLPGSQSFFSLFFDVLMKIFHTFLRASCYARTCQPPRLGKKRIFGMWFPQKFRLKEIKKKERRRGNEKISLLNLH